VKRALRIAGFPSFAFLLFRLLLWDQDALVRGRSRGRRWDRRNSRLLPSDAARGVYW